ncbi:MAG: hypothetical protein C4518_17210 [Desulfobacteraceae bacterium]|nr:MAG: hypothetical protein C4518_17210 [Desulfobacteraceae bacterium]
MVRKDERPLFGTEDPNMLAKVLSAKKHFLLHNENIRLSRKKLAHRKNSVFPIIVIFCRSSKPKKIYSTSGIAAGHSILHSRKNVTMNP